ncbi:AAA family ATPase [Paraburkholderia ferrariae]|uniref:AAA family ATPase n=1 Tax=Paraburkholderia ferrariae TaxID=386056 RepID=UPI0007C6D778|nr:AAA family ATPase [Paraburkholderia ferrariae]
MIDILTISNDPERLDQAARLIAACGNYRTTRVAGGPALLLDRGDMLGAFDVLIVDVPSPGSTELATIAELCRRHPRLTCVLVTADTSSTTVIAAMRAGVRDVLNWPLDAEGLGDALQRAVGQRPADASRRTPIAAFMSSRGGVGTSFLAANVAHGMACIEKKRVLLVDLNQQFADAAFLISSSSAPSTLDQMSAQIDRMDAAFFEASVIHAAENFDILAGAGDPVKAAGIRADRLEWILGVATPRYDFVVVDIGQSINQLSMLALDRSDHIHVVLHATMPHLHAGRRLLEILGSLGYGNERIRLVLNRYGKEGARAREAIERTLGHAPFHVVPEDPRAAIEAVNHGLPVSEAARKSALARSLRGLSAKLASGVAGGEQKSAQRESLFGRLMGRRASASHAGGNPSGGNESAVLRGEQHHVAS